MLTRYSSFGMETDYNKFERAYDDYIEAVKGNASAKQLEHLLAKVAQERAVTVEQIGRKIGLLMGRRFQENKTDPEWLLLCSIRNDLSGLL
jgi:hypothetical protein